MFAKMSKDDKRVTWAYMFLDSVESTRYKNNVTLVLESVRVNS